jgi:hypothetical protein
VITILGLTLLAGLVFFTFNVGVELNRRRDLQDAADAAALAGAHWMSRCMNLIAAGNFGQSKALAMVPILDSLPLSSRIARYELEQWILAIDAQLGPTVRFGGDEIVARALANLRARMELQLEVITPWDEMLNGGGLDMSTFTAYRSGMGGAAPQGRLWQAALALDELSQISAFVAGYFAQRASSYWARLNGAQGSILVPVAPEIPVRRGTYADFRYPLVGREDVTSSSMELAVDAGSGGAIPDASFPYRLGPYARLVRWRHFLREATGWEYIPPTGNPPQQSGGQGLKTGGRRTGHSVQRPASGGGRRGHWRATGWRVYGYRTRGPYQEAMRRIDFMDHDLWTQAVDTPHVGQDTFFSRYLRQQSQAKLRYLVGDNRVRSMHEPRWDHLEYPQAKAYAQAEGNRVHQTMFYVVEVVSTSDPGAGDFAPGTYRSNEKFPITIWANGWVDPDKWNIPKVANHIWQQRYGYRVTYDDELGLAPRYDAQTGEPIWYDLWMTRYYIFVGIDTGTSREISNPANFEGGDPLPAPTLIDPRDGDLDATDPHNVDVPFRRNYFTFMAMVRRPGQQETWTRRFGNAGVSGSVHAMAQAQVFNASSWGFWTQDWHAKLSPMTGWRDWVDRMEAGRADLWRVGDAAEAGELDQALRYLRALGPDLFDAYRRQ